MDLKENIKQAYVIHKMPDTKKGEEPDRNHFLEIFGVYFFVHIVYIYQLVYEKSPCIQRIQGDGNQMEEVFRN